MPNKQIKLAHFEAWRPGEKDGRKCYKVITVRNSTRYSPGEVLERPEVDELCEQLGWEVVIVSLDPKKEGGS